MCGLIATDDLSADKVVAAAGERHGAGLVLACSFQKEESVLLDLVTRLAPRTRVVAIDTGALFPETYQTWEAFEEHFGIEIASTDARGTWTGPDNCCGQAKVAALAQALVGAGAWMTGLRREQSPTRAQTRQVERDEARGLLKYNPLAAWTEREIWRTIHNRGLPYNPLHDRGFDSIGCAPCTQPGSGREGRWAGSEKTECGLHVAEPA
jgi:phosphoadenosine phosphosulfate reductase